MLAGSPWTICLEITTPGGGLQLGSRGGIETGKSGGLGGLPPIDLVNMYATRVILALAATLAALAAGCSSDPRFEKASRVRLDRIDRVLANAEEREQDCDRRLALMNERIEDSMEYHRVRLQKDLDWLDRSVKHEVDRWPARRQRQAEFVDDQLDGNVPQIDKTIPLMFY